MEIWWCRECGKTHPISGWEDEGEIAEREKCRTEHKTISVLEPVEGSSVSERPDVEPMRTTYFYAVDQDGNQWVVKKSRTDINEPFVYEISEGRIATWISPIRVQKEDIQQQLKNLQIKKPYEDFLIAFLKRQTPSAKYNTEAIDGDSDPEIQLLLNQRLVNSMLRQAAYVLEGGQWESFRDFIERENVPGGALPFLGRRNFRII